MINFIFGNNGSGKTTEILRRLMLDAEQGVPSILIVPEQQAVQTEQMTLDLLPPGAQLTLEVTNFSRLYNRVCREYGGLCYSYVTKPIKHILMWQALRQISPLLEEYSANAAQDPSFSRTMLTAISELKASGISVEQLEKARAECDTDSELSRKLIDIARVYAAYDALVSERYSDSSDDLSKLYDMLCEHDFFSGKNVYIDSFTSFTAVEHKIIERIFAQAENVCITVPLSSPTHSDISTASIESSLKRLKRSADRWGSHTDTVLEGTCLGSANELARLCENLWDMSGNINEMRTEANGHIVMELCDNSYAEAEAVASHILELLRGGASCSDVVVIMRDAEKYRGIIEPALENAGIPFYFSEKTDLCAIAPVKLLLTALRIDRYNWRRNDVISYIKTGLCNCSPREADIFEEYINTWSISGSRFTDGAWTMNPDGFTERLSERGKEMLAIANKVRDDICAPLDRYFVMLHASETIPDMCRATYAFLEEIGLEEKLGELSLRERKWGNFKSADELASAYSVILRALADIAEALYNSSATVEEFFTVVKTVFEHTEIGTIPTSIDEVTIGSASLLRSSHPKYVFVMGLCEGEFPASTDTSGLLTDNDKAALTELGYEIGTDNDTRSSEELMFVKNAFASPRDRLYLLASSANAKGETRTPSLPYRRVQAIFDIQPHRFVANDLSYLCGSPRSATAHMRGITDASKYMALKKAISEHIPAVDELSDVSVSSDEIRVSPELVRTLIGDSIYISPSSLEKYVKCPFSYYASYMLSLREPKYGRFGANNFGSFVHYVLENLIRFAVPSSEGEEIPSKAEIEAKTDEIIERYIRMISPDDAINTKRMAHLYSKLRRLSLLLISNVTKEFADTTFRPAFFELHTNGKDGNPAPIEIPLEGGARVVLKGFIDRVDLWKNGDKVYVRIVDYKTGSKSFDLADVAVGLNTQMLLYLFSVCTAPGARLRTVAGIEDDDSPIPAGIVYLSSALPSIKLNDYRLSEEDILKLTEENFSRSGLVINDEDVLGAFSASGSSDLLLGVAKKDGKYVGKALIDTKDFENLHTQILDILTDIGNKIYSGIADCAPISYGGADPCKYCTAKPICRKNDLAKGDY